jgi:hypothetical protein
VGFPIRRSPGQRPFAPHRSISLLIASFVAGRCQGIPRVPLFTSNYTFSLSGGFEQELAFLAASRFQHQQPIKISPAVFQKIARTLSSMVMSSFSREHHRSTISVLVKMLVSHKEYGSTEKERRLREGRGGFAPLGQDESRRR